MSDGKVNTNQTSADPNVLQRDNLRAYSACAVCPTCKNIQFTRSEQKCNILDIVFACCCSGCWYCWHILKKKDLNCYDAVHHCSNNSCKAELAQYHAC